MNIPSAETPIRLATGLALCEMCKCIVRTSGTTEPVVVCDNCVQDMYLNPEDALEGDDLWHQS